MTNNQRMIIATETSIPSVYFNIGIGDTTCYFEIFMDAEGKPFKTVLNFWKDKKLILSDSFITNEN